MPSISYAITAHNEAKELKRLLSQLENITRPIDEIVIQLDETATSEVKDIVKDYKTITFGLNGDFASFKNNLKDNCRCSWVFFIDADEYLSENLADNLGFDAGVATKTPYSTNDLQKADEQVLTATKFKTGRGGEISATKYSDMKKK